jgi:hypothetical protein
MKRLLCAVCVLAFACSTAWGQDSPYWQPGPPPPPPKSLKRGKGPPPLPPLPPPPRRDYVCNTEWKPVCARTRHNIVAIYSNRCFAEQDGAYFVGPMEDCQLLPCPANYEPVCARLQVSERQFVIRPYYHECAARENKAVPLTSWAEFRERHAHFPEFSRRGTIDMEFVCPSTCSGKLEVVCAEDEFGRLRLYANRCQAILEGAIFKKYGVCAGGGR